MSSPEAVKAEKLECLKFHADLKDSSELKEEKEVIIESVEVSTEKCIENKRENCESQEENYTAREETEENCNGGENVLSIVEDDNCDPELPPLLHKPSFKNFLSEDIPDLVIADSNLLVKTLTDLVTDVIAGNVSDPEDQAPPKPSPSRKRRKYVNKPIKHKKKKNIPESVSSDDKEQDAGLSIKQEADASEASIDPLSNVTIKQEMIEPAEMMSELTPALDELLRLPDKRKKIMVQTLCPGSEADSLRKIRLSLGSGDKEKQCPTCNKLFSQKLHLQRHIKSVHDHIRDNMCTFCGKGFMLKSHLMEHIRAVHFKIKNHICQYCGWKFNRTGDLNRHVKNIHRPGENGAARRKYQRRPRDHPSLDVDVESNTSMVQPMIPPTPLEHSPGSPGNRARHVTHSYIKAPAVADLENNNSDNSDPECPVSMMYDQPSDSNNSLSSDVGGPLSLTDKYIKSYRRSIQRQTASTLQTSKPSHRHKTIIPPPEIVFATQETQDLIDDTTDSTIINAMVTKPQTLLLPFGHDYELLPEHGSMDLRVNNKSTENRKNEDPKHIVLPFPGTKDSDQSS